MTERGPWEGDFERTRAGRDAIRREVGESARRTVVLKDVKIALGSNTVHHKLGRKPQGWRPQRERSYPFFQIITEQRSDERVLVLYSSGATTLDLEVW